jgi:hypothetical protein
VAEYAKTIGGTKLHLVREQDPVITECGFDVWQLVLVEEPLPEARLCEWCLSVVASTAGDNSDELAVRAEAR